MSQGAPVWRVALDGASVVVELGGQFFRAGSPLAPAQARELAAAIVERAEAAEKLAELYATRAKAAPAPVLPPADVGSTSSSSSPSKAARRIARKRRP